MRTVRIVLDGLVPGSWRLGASGRPSPPVLASPEPEAGGVAGLFSLVAVAFMRKMIMLIVSKRAVG
jgi:hypothetical protein